MKKACLRFVLPILIILLSFIKVSASSPVLASDCTPPNIPSHFTAQKGPGAGQVTLYWDQVPGASRYAVAYGTKSGNYIYGADHIGEEQSRSYTVSLLTSTTPYYFVLSAANNSCASGFSREATAVSSAVTVKNEWLPASNSSSLLQAQPGANSGEVNLTWSDVSDANNYHLVYGRTSKVNEYGVLNIGKQTHFAVSKLNPGEKYYFAIIPVRNDQTMNSLGPVSTYSAINQSAPTKVLTQEPPSATPTQTQILPQVTQIPQVSLMPSPTPQVSSGPSYFVP